MTSSSLTLSRTLLLLPVLGLLALGQSTVMLEPIADTSIYEELSPSSQLSNGGGEGLFSGVTISGLTRRALMQFDIQGNIPAGSTITNVALDMEVTMALTGAGIPNNLHRATLPWGEGTVVAPGMEGGGGLAMPGDATWLNNFLGTSTWVSPGGDFVGSSGTALAAGIGASVNWDSSSAMFPAPMMVSDVQGWLDGTLPNFGWFLIGDESTIPTARRFASREAATGRPTLTVTYMPPVPMASATTVGTGCGPGPLTLAANGLPQLGNFGFALDVTGGPAGLPAPLYFATGIAPAPLPISAGCFLYLDLTSAIALINSGASPLFTNTLSGAGTTSFPIPLPNLPSLGGLAVDLQIVMPGASGGLISSNAISLVIGN